MNIKLLQIGQTKQNELDSLVQDYEKRLSHFIKFESISLPDIKNTKKLSKNQQKEKEAKLFLKYIHSSDWVVLLDEKGKNYSSKAFAKFYQDKMNTGLKTLCFLIGGPYGFSDEIYNIAHQKASLSPMTFTHEMIRLIFVEQTYRAFSILHHLPYHHE